MQAIPIDNVRARDGQGLGVGCVSSQLRAVGGRTECGRMGVCIGAVAGVVCVDGCVYWRSGGGRKCGRV